MSEELVEELNEEVEQTEEDQAQAEQEEYDKVFYGEDNEANDDVSEEVEAELPKDDDEEATEEVEEVEEPQEEAPTEDETEEIPQVEEAKEMVTLKWRGKEIQVTQQEAVNMAQQNFDITHKYQEVANLRKTTKADLDLLEKAKKGDKQALAQIIQTAEVDPIDLVDVDIEQGPSQPKEEPFLSPQVAEMMEEVSQDEQLFQRLQSVERELPEAVINVMAKNPETFYAIVNEVKSGDAEIVLPQMQVQLAQLPTMERNLVSNNPDAFASFYSNVKNSMIEQARQQKAPPPEKKPQVNHEEVAVRKSGRTKPRGEIKTDSFSSDEAYEAILKRLEG